MMKHGGIHIYGLFIFICKYWNQFMNIDFRLTKKKTKTPLFFEMLKATIKSTQIHWQCCLLAVVLVTANRYNHFDISAHILEMNKAELKIFFSELKSFLLFY